jgi:hypothetical protein
VTSCAWCEQLVDERDRQSIRLSNSQPPWTLHSGIGAAAAIASAGQAFAEMLREEAPIVLWFHRPCWREFVGLLRGR